MLLSLDCGLSCPRRPPCSDLSLASDMITMWSVRMANNLLLLSLTVTHGQLCESLCIPSRTVSGILEPTVFWRVRLTRYVARDILNRRLACIPSHDGCNLNAGLSCCNTPSAMPAKMDINLGMNERGNEFSLLFSGRGDRQPKATETLHTLVRQCCISSRCRAGVSLPRLGSLYCLCSLAPFFTNDSRSAH